MFIVIISKSRLVKIRYFRLNLVLPYLFNPGSWFEHKVNVNMLTPIEDDEGALPLKITKCLKLYNYVKATRHRVFFWYKLFGQSLKNVYGLVFSIIVVEFKNDEVKTYLLWFTVLYLKRKESYGLVFSNINCCYVTNGYF